MRIINNIKKMKFGVNFFAVYILFFSIFFSVGLVVSMYLLLGTVSAVFTVILISLPLMSSAIDYVIPKSINLCMKDGKIYLKYLSLIELDKNKALVKIEEVFNFSRASIDVAIILYLDRTKIGSISFKNKIRLIGGISENQAKRYLEIINSSFGIVVM